MDTTQIKIFDVTVGEDRSQIREVMIRELRPKWDAGDIIQKSIGGGNINPAPIVYHLAADEDISDGIVVRVFGPTSAMTCRERETSAMQIAEHAGCSPKVLAMFTNGIIYQYAIGKCLEGWQITDRKVARLVARGLADLHFVDTSKVTLIDRRGHKVKFPDSFVMFDRLHSSLDSFLWDRQDMPLIECMRDEVDYVREIISDLDLPRASCCHGDFNPCNVVYDDKTGKVNFVDYEFSACGLPAYDFMFMLDVYVYKDILPGYPTSEERVSDDVRAVWVTSYLERRNELQGRQLASPQQEEVDQMLKELEIVEVLTPLVFAGVIEAFYTPTNPLPFAPLFARAMETYLMRKPTLTLLVAEYRQLRANPHA